MAYIRCKGAPTPLVFGTGADGDQIITSNATWYASAEDTGVIEKNYKSLVINSGVSISAGNRNSGIIIRCLGDCTINGAIYNLYAPRSHNTDLSAYYPSWLISNTKTGGGGNGGTAGTWNENTPGYGGAGQGARFYGGGYGGGGGGGGALRWTSTYWRQGDGGNGGSGADVHIWTSNFFTAGSGGYATGGSGQGQGVAGGAGSASGGGGGGGAIQGTGVSIGGNGGSGAGGNGYNGSTNGYSVDFGGGGGAGNYGGGVVIIYCGRTLTINGAIYCYGSTGGTGGAGYRVSAGGGGGGGGGAIYLLYREALSVPGTCNVNPGSGNSGGNWGASGGYGTKMHISYSNFQQGAGAPTAF